MQVAAHCGACRATVTTIIPAQSQQQPLYKQAAGQQPAVEAAQQVGCAASGCTASAAAVCEKVLDTACYAAGAEALLSAALRQGQKQRLCATEEERHLLVRVEPARRAHRVNND